MSIVIDNSFWNNAAANAFGSLFAISVSGLFIYLIINPVKRWIYRQDTKLGDILRSILAKITKPYGRLIIFILSLVYLYLNAPIKEISLVINFLVFISFFDKKNVIYKLTSTLNSFHDNFSNKNNQLDKTKWFVKTGTPKIYFEMGHPKLNLTMANPPETTNSFLLVKDKYIQRGIVECDLYLSPDSVFNIVFFCNEKSHKWHMARYEGRQTESDAFLIKDEGPGANWRFNKILGTRANPGQWNRIRVEFTTEKAKMFRNGDLLGEITNLPAFGNQVGFFNECGEVLIGDFSISEI